MPRITPKLLTFKIDGTERYAELSKFVLSAADADAGFVSFKAAREGGTKEYFANMTAAQDTDAGTLWHLQWTRAGQTIPCSVYHGDVTGGTLLISGTLTIAAPDGDFFGAEADTDTEVATFDFSWKFTAKPTLGGTVTP